ncbi:MAG TPA: tRNA glutamyl-Q(34) synthetase GluQRS [Pseudomonadales bacterium]|nr:tRNA glutamyl-Q(34) synthetase GluQRS [Pseudomonadales bacterium]
MYVGRFAPSPSGPLHAGSLLTAVASYVDARAAGGRWLVRIEDLDPPREMPGADQLILQTLQCHGLHWDGEVFYQSTRCDRYRAVLTRLAGRGLTYRCACNRTRLSSLGHCYDGWCRSHTPPADVPCAIRLLVPVDTPDCTVHFCDRIQGEQEQSLAMEGDYIIHRKDGLFAYQLAVVVDDLDQGITDVVRGSDILDSTARQIYLASLLGGSPLRYAHVPVLTDADGQKLSKQNHAPALDNHQPVQNLWHALDTLGQRPAPSLQAVTPAQLLAWAITNWDIRAIPRLMQCRG